MASKAEKRWRGRIERWRRGGQSVASFCRSEGISGSSFYAWRRRLEEADGESVATAPAFEFVELEKLVAPAAAPIELVVTDVVVRLARDVDGRDLATVLEVLGARQ